MLKQLSETLLRGWVRLVCRAAPLVLLAAFTLAFFAVRYTMDNLSMNTDTEDMLSAELPWRQLDQEYERLFPQYDNNILIVLEAATPDQAADAAQQLYQGLQAQPQLFEFIYYPGALPLFRDSGLLHLEVEELQDLSDRLAQVQPLLARLARDPTLVGLFETLGAALEARTDGEQVDIEPVLRRVNTALEALRDGRPYRLSWQQLISGDEAHAEPGVYREFILTQPELDYADLFPATAAIEQIRQVYAELDLARAPGAELRLSGAVMLAHEEMQSVMQGTETAVVLALCLVTVIMLTGLGSPGLVLATVISLLTGLACTAAVAILTVGELNLISIAFAVLYIGLGVDFAIHYCLRYREYLTGGVAPGAALEQTSVRVGGSLFLCALSTAIGFFAFIPTAYSGVAELGRIAGTGMFISFVVTLTVIPALLSLLPVKPGKEPGRETPAAGSARLVERHAGTILGLTAMLALAAALTLGGLRFDPNPLNLHDQDGAALTTYRQLLADQTLTPWTGIMIAADALQAEEYRAAFNRSELVEKVVTVADFIPTGQEEKLFIIDELGLLLGDLSDVPPAPATQTAAARRSALRGFRDTLRAFDPDASAHRQLLGNLESLLEEQGGTAARRRETNRQERRLAGREQPPGLRAGTDAMSAGGNGGGGDELAQLEQMLLASLPGRLQALTASLNADYVSLDTLPEQFKRFWLSADGHYRLELYSQRDLQDHRSLAAFVHALQAVSPAVTGAPVINLEASAAVATAFKQAFLYAFIAITLMLCLLLAHKRDVLLVLLPLLVAALLTGGASVLLGLPLNFANVIALPLLLGIGVDSGIHIIHRFRTDLPDGKNVLATSSARAVVVSSLTTMGGVGNLALSPHAGTASMGMLLTLGIAVTLACMLLALPALLTLCYRRQDAG